MEAVIFILFGSTVILGFLLWKILGHYMAEVEKLREKMEKENHEAHEYKNRSDHYRNLYTQNLGKLNRCRERIESELDTNLSRLSKLNSKCASIYSNGEADEDLGTKIDKRYEKIDELTELLAETKPV